MVGLFQYCKRYIRKVFGIPIQTPKIYYTEGILRPRSIITRCTVILQISTKGSNFRLDHVDRLLGKRKLRTHLQDKYSNRFCYTFYEVTLIFFFLLNLSKIIFVSLKSNDRNSFRLVPKTSFRFGFFNRVYSDMMC